MFAYCDKLAEFDADLSSLEEADRMFTCSALYNIKLNLPKLTNGEYMFLECKNLVSGSIDAPEMTNGENMFNACYNLK
jgi:hypothetical protein